MTNRRYIVQFGITLVITTAMGLAGCVDSLDPETIGYQDQLVVDGLITDETKQHRVSIGHVSTLSDPQFTPEEHASVMIVDDKNNFVSLSETAPGIYQTPFFAGVPGNKYTLRFTTTSGRKYTSQPVLLKKSPAIEKIYAAYPASDGRETGIQIYLNSANGNKAANYYRWEYEDTYEIKTPYPSKFVWLGANEYTLRLQQVDNCWATNLSKKAFVQSTVGQSQDQVIAFPIKFIPATSQEITIKYSILIKQYAIGEDSYFYWKKIRDLNEAQGSLYDKQPGNITGNISSITDTNEQVSGFFDAAGIATRRFFLVPKDFQSAGFVPTVYFSSCTESPPIETPVAKLGELMSSNLLLIYDISDGGNTLYLLRKACCDCTAMGTSIKPDYWE